MTLYKANHYSTMDQQDHNGLSDTEKSHQQMLAKEEANRLWNNRLARKDASFAALVVQYLSELARQAYGKAGQ